MAIGKGVGRGVGKLWNGSRGGGWGWEGMDNLGSGGVKWK
jgi:hypothetical protein